MPRAVSTALVAVALAASLLLTAPLAAAKAVDPARSHARGLDFLAGQGGDGPYPAGLAAYGIEAAAAAGRQPESWPTAERRALDSLTVPAPGAPLLQVVRPAYAAALAGQLRSFKGEDLEARLRAGFDGTQFGEATLLNDDVYAGLALLAGGVAWSDGAVSSSAGWLVRQQNADGGWSHAAGGASGTDMTAMVVFLLRQAGPADLARTAALDAADRFLRSTAVPGSGFAETPGGEANCDSTAWALRLGLHEAAPEAWDYLLGLQSSDGGFAYQPGGKSNTLCTAEAVTVLGEALRDGSLGLPPRTYDSPALPALPLLAALTVALLVFRRS